MKDKRQKLALAWPFAMYDPAVVNILNNNILNNNMLNPYHRFYNMPTSLTPGYGAPGAGYGQRFSPYPCAPVPAPAAPASELPHMMQPPYPHPDSPYLHHPNIMQPHLSHPTLHLPNLGLGVPNSTYMSSTSPTSSSGSPTFRPNLISPTHSDASSDCDCTGQQRPNIGAASPTLKVPTSLPTKDYDAHKLGLGTYPSSEITSSCGPVRSTKIEPPKLFQPYKNDLPKKA